MAVYELIRREKRARNGFRAVRKLRNTVNPISYEELMKILDIWVETALALERRDLKLMDRLVERQNQIRTKAA